MDSLRGLGRTDEDCNHGRRPPPQIISPICWLSAHQAQSEMCQSVAIKRKLIRTIHGEHLPEAITEPYAEAKTLTSLPGRG